MVFGYNNSQLTSHSLKDNRPISATGPMPTASSTTYPKETKAVLIHAHPPETFNPIKISSLESQFHLNDPPLDIPTLVSLPLWIRHHSWTGPHGDQRKPPPTTTTTDDNNNNAIELQNDTARALCVNANVESCNFLTTPSLRGDYLVARKDGRDLWVQHLICLKAFCDAVVREFCRGEIVREEEEKQKEEEEKEKKKGKSKRKAAGDGRRRSSAEDEAKDDATREMGVRFRRLASREGFQAFWERWCARKVLATGVVEYARLRGPYDV